jgi:predicted nuclease of predicted toxin-antitoxin system
MSKLLLDENLSPFLAKYLRTLRYDAISVSEAGLTGKADNTIIAWAKKNKRIILTQDLGFSVVYSQLSSSPSVVLIRTKTGTTEILQSILLTLHISTTLQKLRPTGQLIVATEKKIREVSFSPQSN